MRELRNLFQPITVGRMELKNRLVVLAMGTGYAEDGGPSQRLKNFLAERARGGAGLIITPVSPSYSYGHHLSGIYEDALVPGLRDLVGVVHAHGAPLVAQLTMGTHWAKGKDSPEEVGPSAVAARRRAPIPRALSIDEIHQIVEEYGEGARRAREAGFDGVEILAGIGFLISRFMSPCTNKREDEYGGSFENRMRLPLQIIDRCKKKAGEDYTLLWRYSADEFLEGGYDLEGGKEIASVVEKAGVHCLNLQVGWHDSPRALVHREVPLGSWSYLAEGIKKVVDIPVITCYRINDPLLAEQILAEGKADLIGLSRPFIADPDFANKAKEGRFDEVRQCIGCCRCLDEVLAWQKPLDICSVNARLGDDLEIAVKPAAKPKKVFIIGGGPGGMEAARVAANRGHQVTLWEKKSELGGLIHYATIAPYKAEVNKIKDYLTKQIEKLGIDVRLNEEASSESIMAGKPDAVIVATGASPFIPDIPGVDGPNVATALDVLKGEKEVGENVIIIGGGTVGCETAEFLAAKGKKITILEMLERIGIDIGPSDRFVIMMRLRKANIRMETKAKAVGITSKGVKVSRDGVEEFFAGDNVVLAVGMKSDKELALELEGKVPALYSIGDCVEPRQIGEAIKAGYRVARDL